MKLDRGRPRKSASPRETQAVTLRLPRALVDAVEAHRARLEAEGTFTLSVNFSDSVRDLLVKALKAERERPEAPAIRSLRRRRGAGGKRK